MTYLCGCSREQKRGYLLTTQPDGSQGFIRRDKDGFEVCPEHGDRLTGWRDTVQDPRKLTGKTVHNLDFSGTDNRDTRDPEDVYAETKVARLSQSNGHAE